MAACESAADKDDEEHIYALFRTKEDSDYRTVAWDEKQIMELIEDFESDVRNKPVENLGRTSPNPRILPLRDLLKAAVF